MNDFDDNKENTTNISFNPQQWKDSSFNQFSFRGTSSGDTDKWLKSQKEESNRLQN